MSEAPYISYTKYYKPKDNPPSHMPEYLSWYLENRDKLKHIDYRKFYKAANEHK